MNERRLKAVLVVSSLLAAGAVAALSPAAAQRSGGGGGSGGSGGFSVGTGNSNTVANLLLPMAALGYGAYCLAAGLRYHWIAVPHRVGHPYAIPPKPLAREESEMGGPIPGEEGEPKGDDGKLER
jgi:hypothetical protein